MLVVINSCRELKLSKVCLTPRVPAQDSVHTKAGARAMKPGPAWQESQVGVTEESQVAGRFLVLFSVGESRNRSLTSCDHPFG